MSDWQQVVDPSSGQTYYYNAVTQETSWDDPNATVSDTGAAWQEVVDPTSGEKYYYNSVTQETSWDRPAAMGPATAAVPTPSKVSAPSAPSAAAYPSSPVAAVQQNLLPARAHRGTLAVARRSVIPTSAGVKRTVKAAQSLDEQLAARARKFITQRRIERNGNKPAAFAALSRKRAVSVAVDVAKADGTLPTADAATAGDWQEILDSESGQTYFFNPTTGETTWERPQ